MKILYDNIIFSWQEFGGISVVWSNLLSRIIKKQAEVHILEYEGAEDYNLSRKGMNIPTQMITKLSSHLFKIKRYLNPSSSWDNCSERFIFHSSYYRTINHPNAINITTVHDFSYELYETNWLKRKIHIWMKHRAILHSDRVVCISENTLKDLFRLLPDVPAEKVCVIYNGIDSRFHRLPNIQPQEYVLYVGKRSGYKNFEALIEPLAILNLRIKIVGPPLTNEEKVKMKSAGLRYEFCGKVSDVGLNKLYNEAFCLFYTSLYEGFGLPVLEAQQAGCPVIALNASSIPEVIGDQRLLIDHVSKETIEHAIKLLKKPEQRNQIIELGIRNAKRFSWDKMAEEYYDLYDSCLTK